MRTKHPKDTNKGKNGFVSGNIRYKRSKPSTKMGKARTSKN